MKRLLDNADTVLLALIVLGGPLLVGCTGAVAWAMRGAH